MDGLMHHKGNGEGRNFIEERTEWGLSVSREVECHFGLVWNADDTKTPAVGGKSYAAM